MSTLTGGQTVEVVTRYGGFRHLADSLPLMDARHFTLCLGTSAWTLEEWARLDDHPNLTPDQMRDLPKCERCQQVALAGSGTPTDTALPYAGPNGPNSGFSSDSGEAAVRAMDADGRTSEQQKDALRWLRYRKAEGTTWREIAKWADWHHGTASRTLTDLHKAGKIARLAETRVRCKVYVLPEYVNDRDTEEQGRARISDAARAAMLAGLAMAWKAGDLSGDDHDQAKRKVERL